MRPDGERFVNASDFSFGETDPCFSELQVLVGAGQLVELGSSCSILA